MKAPHLSNLMAHTRPGSRREPDAKPNGDPRRPSLDLVAAESRISACVNCIFTRVLNFAYRMLQICPAGEG